MLLRVAGLVLITLLAAPAAQANSRLLVEKDGTVTIEWPERVCTREGVEAEPITFSLAEIDFDSPAASDTPVDDVERDAERPDLEDGIDVTLWPEFPLRPWRVVYRDDGSYEVWHDLTCAGDGVQVDPLDPDARTLMRAARASHGAQVKAERSNARRRSPKAARL